MKTEKDSTTKRPKGSQNQLHVMAKTSNANKKADNKTTKRSGKKETIGLVKNDAYLAPYEEAIKGRHDHYLWKLSQLTANGKKSLTDFANGHQYYGLHKTSRGWVFREWAPNATDLYLVGDFNHWQETERYRARRIEGTGNWELRLSEKALSHGQLYKMHVYWHGRTHSGLVPPCGAGRADRHLLGAGVASRTAFRLE